MKSNQNVTSLLFKTIVTSCVTTTTIVITPILGHDPINIPKAVVLSLHGGALLALIFFDRGKIMQITPKWTLSLLFIFCIALFLPLLTTNSPINEQIFGTWGRSTGVLTYFWLIVILMAGINIGKNMLANYFRKILHRVSYFITGYMIIQYAGLDPIKWVTSAPVATLGNINFTSALLGLANISFSYEVIEKRNNFLQKLHFATFFILNNLLIWQSGSIQGVAMWACGLWIMLLLHSTVNFSRMLTAFYVLATVPIGLSCAFGFAGLGPLGNQLKQDTVLFRTDYWRAGIEMTKANPITGVGIDGYGDFYREFRDILAATRTGPQRISNTAHSVFLDLLSGGGLFLGGSFLVLFVLSIFLGAKVYLSTSDKYKLPLIGINLGYFLFCCISINQIGVAVWGFLFLGILIGQTRLMSQDLPSVTQGKSSKLIAKKQTSKKLANASINEDLKDNSLQIQKWRSAALLVCALASVSVCAPNVIVDLEFNYHYKKRNVHELGTIATKWGAQTYHIDKAIEIASKTEPEYALHLSRKAIDRNPRDFYAWATLLILSTDEGERTSAAKNLQKIDAAYLGLMSTQQVIDSAILS